MLLKTLAMAVALAGPAAHADALSTALGHLRAEGAGKPALETAQLSKAITPPAPPPPPHWVELTRDYQCTPPDDPQVSSPADEIRLWQSLGMPVHWAIVARNAKGQPSTVIVIVKLPKADPAVFFAWFRDPNACKAVAAKLKAQEDAAKAAAEAKLKGLN